MTPIEEGMRGEPGEVLELIGPTGDDRSAMRRALIEQANGLAGALERIRRGEVGI
jgi:hypothetical protein